MIFKAIKFYEFIKLKKVSIKKYFEYYLGVNKLIYARKIKIKELFRILSVAK